jgi:hypothetical protein
MKPRYTIFLISLSGLLSITTETAEATNSSPPPRSLYAVNEAPNDRGSISVYDIDAGHHLIKTVQTVPSGRGSHWLTFDIKGDYGYTAPSKNSADEPKSSTPEHIPLSA